MTSVRSRRAQQALEILRGDERLVTAARIAREFRQDPVAMLRDDGDEFVMLVRIAAAQVVHEDRRKEAEAERKAAKR